MIIAKVPLRISFASGGSDLPAYYRQDYGAALSATIDKYIYVSVHTTPYKGVRTMLQYAIEEADRADDIKHEITRETLKNFYKPDGLEKGVTVSSVSDIIAKGSGLGSSSAFTVGLIHALHNKISRADLAAAACEIEIEKCNFKIGKQDQYAAAYGGINLFYFMPNERVNIHPLNIDAHSLNVLKNNFLLVNTGVSRSAHSILNMQSDAMTEKKKFDIVTKSRDIAEQSFCYLEDMKFDDFGALLHESWMHKKSVVHNISNEAFDSIYESAIKAGALGGKLIGAGGGGFFLFYVPASKILDVIQSLPDTCEVCNFNFTDQGSTIILNS